MNRNGGRGWWEDSRPLFELPLDVGGGMYADMLMKGISLVDSVGGDDDDDDDDDIGDKD